MLYVLHFLFPRMASPLSPNLPSDHMSKIPTLVWALLLGHGFMFPRAERETAVHDGAELATYVQVNHYPAACFHQKRVTDITRRPKPLSNVWIPPGLKDGLSHTYQTSDTPTTNLLIPFLSQCLT